MRVREDYRSITGQEKAAIFLMSLSQDQASKIFANLDDEEIMRSPGPCPAWAR